MRFESRSLLVLISALAAFFPAASHAEFPCCPPCETTIDDVERVLLVPDGNGNTIGTFTVEAHNIWTGQVQPNAVVEVLIWQHDGMLGLCDAQVYTKIADASGLATFTIAGGGCMRSRLDRPAMVIRVNGLECRAYDVLSPDYAGWDNIGQPGRWNLMLDPTDLSAFARAYQGGAGPASCHDYNANGATDAADLSVFAQAYRGGTTGCGSR